MAQRSPILRHQSSDEQTLDIPPEYLDVEDQEDDEDDGVSHHLHMPSPFLREGCLISGL